MCNFFSCLAVKNGEVKLYFTNSDSHEYIIQALGLRDDRLENRMFVRLECQPPFKRVVVDEQGTVPDWFDVVKIFPRVRRLAKKVGTLYEDYKAKRNTLYEDYEAKRNTLYEDYEAKRKPLDEDYEAKRSRIKGFVAMK